jgi:acetyltransferase
MALYETPVFTGDLPQDGPQRVARIIAKAQEDDRVILSEHESKQVLNAYDLPTTPSQIARSTDEAVAAAEAIGYPVVLKLHSETITHKSDRGGVQLNLENAGAVRAAFLRIRDAFRSADAFHGVTVQPMIKATGYELIVGSSTDPQFGPVMVFGLGGQLVEVVRDTTHALPPLTTTLARRMMENTHIFQALKGVRGRKPVDLEKLEEALVRFSELVIENPRIAEIEINPLLVGPDVLLALDARVILHAASVAETELPRPAIRPYPAQYISTWHSGHGTQFTVRPIRPDDEPLMVDFHGQLSDTSVYMRYFLPMTLDVRVAHERLFTKCFIDYDREMALVVEYVHDGVRQLAGIARMIRGHSGNSAEVAFLVADKFQHRGLGTYLLERVIAIARKEGIATLEAATLSENFNMKDLFVKAGFRFSAPEEGVVSATLRLN